MKSPLVYLTVTKLKNQLIALVKSPAKLIYVLFLVALFAFTATAEQESFGTDVRDFSELIAIVTLFYTAMFLMIFVSGSASNSPMFSLSDASLLFPSPLNPHRVLFYGLIRQLGISILLGFFLLFQYNLLNSIYGITYSQLIWIILGYALVLFMAQFCAMAVYVRTSGKDNASKGIRAGVYILLALYLAGFALSCREEISLVLSGNAGYEVILTAGSAFFSSFPGLLFPVSGWFSGAVGAICTQDWLMLAICLGLVVVAFAGILISIFICKNNYYEDVLQTAEVAQSNVTAQKEGRGTNIVPKNVRVGKTGLGKGWGASAIYQKHRIENRRSGLLSISNMSLLFAVIIIVMAVFFREFEEAAPLSLFISATAMQMLTVAMGRFSLEMMKPYIYLIPEPPLKKMLCALKENLISEGIESILIFVPSGLIIGADVFTIAALVVARLSFSLLFISGNVAVERVFGFVSTKGLVLMLYFIVLAVLSAPGIVAAVMLSSVLSLPGLAAGLLVAAVVNTGVSVLVLYLCRNLLQYAELNNN